MQKVQETVFMVSEYLAVGSSFLSPNICYGSTRRDSKGLLAHLPTNKVGYLPTLETRAKFRMMILHIMPESDVTAGCDVTPIFFN